MTGVAAKAISWTESGLVPDTVIRSGMRRLLNRMFFMACEELFRYNGGNEWFVSHYRFKKAGS